MPRTIGQTVHEARRKMADAITAASAQRRTFTTELRQAQNYANDTLSDEGLRQERDRRTQAVRDRHQQTLDGHAAAVNTAVNHLNAALAGRPAADANTMARHEQHWRRAQTLLDAGHGVPQVIANLTDPEALEALRAELPTYVNAKGHQPEPVAIIGLDKHVRPPGGPRRLPAAHRPPHHRGGCQQRRRVVRRRTARHRCRRGPGSGRGGCHRRTARRQADAHGGSRRQRVCRTTRRRARRMTQLATGS